MRILVDVHTHTISSGHAYSTLEENMKAAAQKGMKLVAMTDHSPGMPGGPHPFYFSNLRILPSTMYGVQLLKGVEVNIIDYKGRLDLDDKVLSGLDIAIASLHPPCIDFADAEVITQCLEKVMENPYVSIIGHPGDSRYPMDYECIVKKAQATGTLLEVNNASLKATSSRPGVRENLITILEYCKQYEAPIILGTDAHFSAEIGCFEESIALLNELEFPETLIMNLNPEKLIRFIQQKRLK